MVDLNTFVAWSPLFVFLAYVIAGAVLGRKYLWDKPSEKKLTQYKDTHDTLLVLSGLILAALSIVVALSPNDLSNVQDMMTYLSIALVSSLFGAYLVQNFETRNLFFYLGEVTEYITILSLGLAFYFYGVTRGQTTMEIVFGIFVAGFVGITASNLGFYVESWK